MEKATMGRVITEATIESLTDLWAVEQQLMRPDQARRLTAPDALVDTGATLLSLPTRLIQELDLNKSGSKRVVSSTGLAEAAMYDAVRLTIQGRSCTMDVMEVPDTMPVLIGQIPLEHLDLVVDLRNRVLIGNPANGGDTSMSCIESASQTLANDCPRSEVRTRSLAMMRRLLAAGIILAVANAGRAEGPLSIGDPAPKLEVKEFVKGDAGQGSGEGQDLRRRVLGDLVRPVQGRASRI